MSNVIYIPDPIQVKKAEFSLKRPLQADERIERDNGFDLFLPNDKGLWLEVDKCAFPDELMTIIESTIEYNWVAPYAKEA